ncbi:chaperone modulator CbpM [Acinetobacter pollinis]|jgi:chaperone modulatory protein CbpM|uniref:MerR family transcriptional regulator n=1 Tax=Acinetobacter pollinis TaxID=2605270 RepID=A0ABU6DSY8_9GAMM|nr:chaperone modulator CbpM [Acinetobacter pollinis]MBF7690105.1 MerR family transcriptional regulator [Acinetobacter pollinis]MBF7693041.1 MerR family transcriptional regulator [Acinetobacter pollinis]MBF7697654.1 MerR family transcriptional regulator [Acinetobacter pollinis]MBF7699795.1 MerR family transcriptional regulator [Acinetobacter pollinis]MEB5476954.1 MerR family transcriptional regulator [Acinetobacter pollinis]
MKSRIHYYEVTSHTHHDVEVLHQEFSLERFAEICGQHPNWIIQLIEYDILPERAKKHASPTFLQEDIQRARKAYRLQRDFEASLPAVSVMLDLIDEVNILRQKTKHV